MFWAHDVKCMYLGGSCTAWNFLRQRPEKTDASHFAIGGQGNQSIYAFWFKRSPITPDFRRLLKKIKNN
jgi:hypothetical protein